jgi:hypothetical protein
MVAARDGSREDSGAESRKTRPEPKRHATASGWRWARRGADNAIDVWRERERRRRRRRQQRARGRQRTPTKDQTANRRPSSIETTGHCSEFARERASCVKRKNDLVVSCARAWARGSGEFLRLQCVQVAIARAISADSAADGNSSATERGRRVAASAEGLVRSTSLIGGSASQKIFLLC